MNTVLELEIGPGPESGSYVVHVLRSVGGGEPTQTITLDLDELIGRRPLLEATVLSSSVSARRVMSDTEAAVQDVGRRLFESTFSGAIRTAYRTSTAVASERGRGVQISLRLTAPGLAALPWETLFDAETGVYLCRKEPLVRHVPAPHSPAALAIEPPMRVLGMISSPRGLPTLDVVGERERLEEALRPHLDSGRVELEWLEEVTWNGVHGRLLEGEWHVLHFVGHGTYDVDTDEGVLAFVGRDGRADYVTASSLADLLHEAEPTPRLVVLNSCQSGAGGTTDLFSGTAAALAHSGIRAVAAMQFSISDNAAIEFARGFYTALAHGRGIDDAVRSGRIGILGMGRGTLEWVTPVLYLRGEDTKLFDVAPLRTRPDHGPVPTAGLIPIVHTGPVADVPTGPVPPSDALPATAPTIPPAAEPPKAVTSATARSTPPSESPRRPTSISGSDPPWWTTRPTTTQTPAPPRSDPPTRPTPSAPPPGRRGSRGTTPRWVPWLVVGLIAVVIGGGVATLLATQPWVDSAATNQNGGTDANEVVPEPITDADLEHVVLATDDWFTTGLGCEQDEAFTILATGDMPVVADGQARSGYGQHSHGALIVGLTTVNPEFFSAVTPGEATTYRCLNAGTLVLGINDSNLSDNSGELSVKIWAPAETQ
ncbi:CHAT domain-containing protein [Agromyces humatus]|uniref:CHAT domain-containing protein n=1 Tax=Agromyces humatus TaxID=279573 RepID=A0ABP4X6J7_9MICO|nr:CHAT domain-containing protein [Agromyces humatus]